MQCKGKIGQQVWIDEALKTEGDGLELQIREFLHSSVFDNYYTQKTKDTMTSLEKQLTTSRTQAHMPLVKY